MMSGRTALVTGASSGIGEATARKLGSEGADVVLAYCPPTAETRDRHREQVQETLAVINEAGSEGKTVEADLGTREGVDTLVKATRETAGELDILVNNAGIFPRISLREFDFEEWNRTLDVNVGGLAKLSSELVPVMADGGGGSVINMSSIWAIRGSSKAAPYSASKGAIISLTKHMCREFGPSGVRVNAILPGAIATEMNAAQRDDPSYVRQVESGVPTGRFGQPEDVAELAAFLASPKSSYINGECITIDGGLSTTVSEG